ncbi:MAG: 3-deoxy-8-phosphooctulonate synthase [Candidatus Omnitrophica bacterium]|nr:3-deoxy-8-phosphooctulonate synthase [Candidatus Omnitrophota bacterium]
MFEKNKFIFIAGPCVIENRELTLKIAEYLNKRLKNYPLNFIFKASFDKANRTSLKSFRGLGLEKGLKILREVKEKLKLTILTDVHCQYQIPYVKDIVDVIQIPAFLCRQTDLILAAAKTGKIINIKKGQFISPFDVKYIIQKIESTGNKKIFITERGTCFGYNNLIVDFRSFLIMKKYGYPIIYDATHSLQRPSIKGGVSGGDVEFIFPLSLAAIAAGVDGLFMEVHPHPAKALSDKYTVLKLDNVEKIAKKVIKLKKVLEEDI